MEKQEQKWKPKPKPKPVHLFTDIELVDCLSRNFGISFSVIKNLFTEQVNGEVFLLLEKKDVASLGMLDIYSQLCMFFPMAKFVDEFI
jgi:hypothetical protein